MKMTFVPHHCWKTAITRPKSSTLPYLCCSNSRSPASFPSAFSVVFSPSAFAPASFTRCCGIVAAFNLRNTGLSGMKKLITRNEAAGSVSAQNIQRQPHSMSHTRFSLTVVSRANSMFTICADRMPNTMVIWFKLTIRPRISAGLTSAMYMGESAEATPMPTPPTKRAMLNNMKSLNSPVATADTVNSTAATISRGLRPYLSAAAPATMAPNKHPIRAVVMATPCRIGESVMLK